MRVVLLCGLLLITAVGGASARVEVNGLHTLHGIEPPVLQVTHPAASAVARGLVFVGQKGGGESKPGGPVIADNKGRVLWFDQLKWPVEVTDFRTQTYKGKPVLTVLRGNVIMEDGEVMAEAGSGRLLRGRPDGNGAR